MKNTITLLLFSVTLASCQESRPAKFTIRLKDDAGSPIANYMVHTGTYDKAVSEKKGEATWAGPAKQTGADGRVTFEMPSITGMIGINFFQGLSAKYYLTTIPDYQFQRVENGRWIPENPLIEAVLKRKLKPIPMYVKDHTPEGGGSLKLKESGREYSYDFEVADWVMPEGNGRHRDIIFSYTMTKEANGDYHRVIRVSFPDKGDGLIAFEQDRWLGSELLSAYTAPDRGYVPLVEKTRTMKGVVITDDANKDRNYYFRVRTKLDADGRVVSAHYGKIYGDFMSFIYYFNPTPNDRNVEYDPKRNLFVPEGKPFYQWPECYQVNKS